MTTWRDLERRRHAAILAELREAPQVERSRGGSRTGSKTDDQERDRVIRVEEWRHEARTGIALREARGGAARHSALSPAERRAARGARLPAAAHRPALRPGAQRRGGGTVEGGEDNARRGAGPGRGRRHA